MGLDVKSTQNTAAGPRLRIRRARRSDFVAVMDLLGASGAAVPPPERATLRRFRNIVADLGADFYLASIDETLVGLVHVTYARQLAASPRARLDQLVVADSFRRRGVASALLGFAQERARRRGCTTLCCGLDPAGPAARPWLEASGFRVTGQWYVRTLQSEC